MPVAGKAVPYFKPGKELRERINGAAATGQRTAARAPAAKPEPATVD